MGLRKWLRDRKIKLWFPKWKSRPGKTTRGIGFSLSFGGGKKKDEPDNPHCEGCPARDGKPVCTCPPQRLG